MRCDSMKEVSGIYLMNKKRREISRTNIKDLEYEVKKRGLRWEEL